MPPFTLIIVESPKKCSTIENFLGTGYKCVASFGHIRGILNGLKDIDITKGFKPKFGILTTKNKYISNLRKQIKNAKNNLRNNTTMYSQYRPIYATHLILMGGFLGV